MSRKKDDVGKVKRKQLNDYETGHKEIGEIHEIISNNAFHFMLMTFIEKDQKVGYSHIFQGVDIADVFNILIDVVEILGFSSKLEFI